MFPKNGAVPMTYCSLECRDESWPGNSYNTSGRCS